MAKKLGRGVAIRAINPDAIYNIVNETIDGYESIEWLNDTAPISDEDINAKLAELQAEEDAKAQAKIDNKASAKAKLMAGEALTEEEANVMIGG